MVLISPLWGYLDLLTSAGELWRTHDGTTWKQLARLNFPNPVGYLAGPQAYVLTQDGILLSSSDEGVTWQAKKNFTFSDGVALRKDKSSGLFFALTASGMVLRDTSPSHLLPVGHLPASDLVDLGIHSGLSPLLYALTASGDVYRSSDSGKSWQLVGQTGFSDMQALTMLQDTLLALTYQGDVLRSVDSGKTWVGWSTLSQLGAVDLHADEAGNLFAALFTGEFAQFQRSTSSWSWIGTPSQMGVVLLATGGPATFEGETRPTPPPTFTVRPAQGGLWLIGLPPGTPFRIWSVTGRRLRTGTVSGSLHFVSLPGQGICILEVDHTRTRVILP